jgi:hypothetical protein
LAIWWDPIILLGKTWDQTIEAALDEARSGLSFNSTWCRLKPTKVVRRRILVPALLDDVKIPLGFQRIQAASLIGWSGTLPSAAFARLAEAVSRVLASSVSTAIQETEGTSNAAFAKEAAVPRVQSASPTGTDLEWTLTEAQKYYADRHTTLPLFRKAAADAGNATAMNCLGNMHATGVGGLPKDESQAVIWYRKALDASDFLGMANLASWMPMASADCQKTTSRQ